MSKPVEPRSFARNATLIGALTFGSRLLGLARESIAAGAFGANPVWSAFVWAFTIPNLFRKLLGEGALSSAFIPLYAQAVKNDGNDGLSARDFALVSVNLQCIVLVVLTVLGELALLGCYCFTDRPDYQLAIKLAAVMLPYALFVCATALLGAILQVHHRFTAITATSIVLNAVTILGILVASVAFDLRTPEGQVRGTYLLAVTVLAAGVIQIAILVPSLRAVGFTFRPVLHVLTPQVRHMLALTLPVALSAGVLQIGVLLDKGIAFYLARSPGHDEMSVLGLFSVSLPMAQGAAARLNWAQYMYQFPLGVFSIALATAIFPKLASDALGADKTAFRDVLRRGISASLFIGLPSSVGMVLVAMPAINFLFRHGNFSPEDARLTVLSTAIYSAAIWAFSLQLIVNRAYYALHDSRTPLIWAGINLGINLVVELPLLWTPLAESAMAVGTLVSFVVQSLAMTWSLSRRVGGIGLRRELRPVAVMVIASLLMGVTGYVLTLTPLYPAGAGKVVWATQLALHMLLGATVYGVLCHIGGIDVLAMVPRRRRA